VPIVHELLPTDVTDDTSAVHDATALAAVLSVLGDPTRLAILSHLRGGEHRVGELADGSEHDAAGPDEVDSTDSIDVVVNTAAPGDAETVGSSDDESEVQA